VFKPYALKDEAQLDGATAAPFVAYFYLIAINIAIIKFYKDTTSLRDIVKSKLVPCFFSSQIICVVKITSLILSGKLTHSVA